MNIEKIKEFIALREELKAAGVIGLSVYNEEVQIDKEILAGESDLRIEKRGCDKYPYEISTVRDGITLFCIATDDELLKYFPQFVECMEEDVDLSGGEEVEEQAV
jgi:hypothetical protein